MQAVIMAGGEGSRLRPLTGTLPKPMLPIANRPLMEHILLLLRSHGITDVVATVQYMSSVIRNYFGDGSDLGVTLSYSTEDEPLGTAGSVLNASDLLQGTFLIISGDALTDIDLDAVIAFHRERGASATMVLKRMKDPLEFGIVMTSEEGKIERFLEKPSWGQVFTDTINTGIYVIEPEVLDLIPSGEPYDFSSQLFPMMLDKGLPLYGWIADGYWSDVGNAEAFLAANRAVLARRVKVSLQGFEITPGVLVGQDVVIHPSARIEGPAIIGDNSRVGPEATVGPYAVLGTNCLVGERASVLQGVALDRAHIAAFARLRGGVLGRASSLDKGAVLEEGAVTGDEVTVGAGAMIKPRVKIYPSRSVEAGAIVTQSIVHERRALRGLFGQQGVSGLVNLGVTPQVAVRLAMAYGSTLPRGGVVVTGRDGSRAARAMKRALIAGLNSSGITVHDLELAPMPLTRFAVRSEQAAGGISVRTSTRGPETVEIRLFDPDGADLSESEQRKIERIFYREDYRRPGSELLGELEFPPHAVEQYAAGILRALDVAAIRERSPKVVVDYASSPHATIGPVILGRLGCDALAVNAYTDEHRPVLQRDALQELATELAEHVTRSGSDLGFLIEPGGEEAWIVDDAGDVISHERALLAFLKHELERGVDGVALPISSPAVTEAMVRDAGAKVRWTPTAPASVMAAAAASGAGFAGDVRGLLIFGDLMPAPDALMTFGKTLEMVAHAGVPLSELVARLPEVHLVTRDVDTPWHEKGKVMRTVASSAPAEALTLIDGVRISEDDGWVLVLPHPSEPRSIIWAEGPTPEAAAAIADRYVGIVYEVVQASD